MKHGKIFVFWTSLAIYTLGYLYFYLSALETSVWTLFHKSLLSTLRNYFASDWMLAPVIVFGICFLFGCGMLTYLTYGVFRRATALLPAGGLMLFGLHLLLCFAAETVQVNVLCAVVPVIATVYLPLLLGFFVWEYKANCAYF